MKTRKGFTFVEILVFMLIFGILAAMYIPQFSSVPAPPNPIASDRVAEAKKVFEPNETSILMLSISRMGANTKLQKIYCVGNDKKTVEQYVEAVTSSDCFIEGWCIENLVRKGATPCIGEIASDPAMKEMTPERAEELDKEYRTLRGNF